MASLANLIVRISADAGPLERGLERAERRSQQFGVSIGGASGLLWKFGAAAAGALAGLRLVKGAYAAITQAFEKSEGLRQARFQFEALLGSVTAAGDAVQRLERLASGRGLDLDETLGGGRKLAAAGLTGAELVGTMERLANLAGVTDARLDDLAATVAKVHVEGRVSAKVFGDLERTVPMVAAALVAMSGQTRGEFVAAIKAGQVGVAEFEAALERVAGAGSRAADAAAAQASTMRRRLAAIGSGLGDLLVDGVDAVESGMKGLGLLEEGGLLDRLAYRSRRNDMTASADVDQAERAERARAAAMAAAAAEQAAAIGKVEEALQQQIATFGLSAEQAELLRLARSGATEAELAHARALEGQLAALAKRAELEEGAAALMDRIDDTGRITRERNQLIQQLNFLLDRGRISLEQYQEQVRRFDAAARPPTLAEQEAAKLEADLRELTRAWEQRAATVGMAADQVRLYELAQRGATAAQLAELRALAEQEQRLQRVEALKVRAAQVLDEMRTPAERLGAALAELAELLEAGLLTREQYMRAVEQRLAGVAGAAAGGAAAGQLAGSAARGSREAVSQLARERLRGVGEAPEVRELRAQREQLGALVGLAREQLGELRRRPEVQVARL